jgi:sugar O-acyltransferase (sialic acid O-acetyltransferase NeuD family)
VTAVILFGVRSPITVEYEESCHRLGLTISAAVSLGKAPRVLDPSRVVAIADFTAPAGGGGRFYACAFTAARRQALFDQAEALGLTPAPALIDPHAVLARSVRIDDGSFVNAGAVIGALSFIGRGVLINRSASIGHHAMIGDFVSIGPGATLAGNIRVGAGTIIGAGATILPDIRIGENALIAGGSLVRENVPDATFVAGNPAKARPFDPTKSTLYVEDGE